MKKKVYNSKQYEENIWNIRVTNIIVSKIKVIEEYRILEE